MIAFEDAQQHATDLIAAHAYFSGETVIAELGLGSDAREAALNGRGICVSVLPLDEGRASSQGTAAAGVRVSVITLLEVNPRVNAEQAQKDVYLAIKAIKAALLAYTGVNPNDRYSVAERAFDFSDHDPGLLGYLQTFNKIVVF
jgi:hypothetical protein